MKEKRLISTLISAAIAALISVACTEDVQEVNYAEVMNNALQDMKGSYVGNYLSAGTVPKRMLFTIDEQANIVVEKFPLDNILAKLYPNDYLSITSPTDLPVYTTPIDSFRIDMSYRYLNIKTSDTEQIHFTYLKNDVQHTGWAQLYATGIYNILLNTLTIQFTINDMMIDGQDKQNLTPIYYFIDSAVKE